MLETNTLLKNDYLKQFEDAASTSKVVCDHSLGQFTFMAICEKHSRRITKYTPSLVVSHWMELKSPIKKNICSFLSFQTAKLFKVPGHRSQCCVISVHNVNGLILGYHPLYFRPLLPHCTFR